jgi:integrase
VKGSTFKRCGCRDPKTGRQLGRSCPQLRRADGAWSRQHGQWHWQFELPASAAGGRRPVRHGAYAGQADAEAVLDRVRAALAVADPADTLAQCRIGDLIQAALKAGEPVPDPDQVRRALHLDICPHQLPTVGEYLVRWLAGRRQFKHGIVRCYDSHIRRYLTPHLGAIRIDRLRPGHVQALLDTIDEHNSHLAELRASPDPMRREQAKRLRLVGPATVHRIHATLRKALNDAIRRERLIDTNPALMVELPLAKPPKAMVWTTERVTSWRRTGVIPGPVMVWTPEQVGAFLDHASEDRLYPLYHLLVHTGLRRGEACAVHWDDLDLDLDTATLTVRWQIVQHGWATAIESPKTDDSQATIAVDTATIAVLRTHRACQHRERLAAGPAWTTTGLAFTTPTGGAMHRPRSPTTSTPSPTRPACRRSGCTTCATPTPLSPWPPASRSKSSPPSSATPAPPPPTSSTPTSYPTSPTPPSKPPPPSSPEPHDARHNPPGRRSALTLPDLARPGHLLRAAPTRPEPDTRS